MRYSRNSSVEQNARNFNKNNNLFRNNFQYSCQSEYVTQMDGTPYCQNQNYSGWQKNRGPYKKNYSHPKNTPIQRNNNHENCYKSFETFEGTNSMRNYPNTGRNFDTQRQYQPNNQYFPQPRQFVRGARSFRDRPYSRGRGYRNRGNYTHFSTNFRNRSFGNESRDNFSYITTGTDHDSSQSFKTSNEEAIDLTCDIIPENKTSDNSDETSETLTDNIVCNIEDSDSETICLDEMDHMVPTTPTIIDIPKERHTSQDRNNESSENKIRKLPSPCEGSPKDNCVNTHTIPLLDSTYERQSSRNRKKCWNSKHSTFVVVEKDDDSQDPRLSQDKKFFPEIDLLLGIFKWKEDPKKPEKDVINNLEQIKELDASGQIVTETTPKDAPKFKDPRELSEFYRNQQNKNKHLSKGVQKHSVKKKFNSKLISSSIKMKEHYQKSKTRPDGKLSWKQAIKIHQINKNKPIVRDKNFIIRRDNQVIRRHYSGSVSKFSCYVSLSRVNNDKIDYYDDNNPSCIDDSVSLLDSIDTKQSYLPTMNKKEETGNAICETNITNGNDDDKLFKKPDDKDRGKLLIDSNKNLSEGSKSPEECRTNHTPPVKKLNFNKNKQEDSIKRRFFQKYRVGNESPNTLKNKNKPKKALAEKSDEIDKNITYSPKTDIKKKLYDACTDSYHDLDGVDQVPSRDLKNNAENSKQKQLTDLFGDDLSDLAMEENGSSERPESNSKVSEQPSTQGIKRRMSDSCEDTKITPKKIGMRRKTLPCTIYLEQKDNRNISEIRKFRKKRKSPSSHEIESSITEEENKKNDEESLSEPSSESVTIQNKTAMDKDQLNASSESFSINQNIEKIPMKKIEDPNRTSEHKDKKNEVLKAQSSEQSSKRQHPHKPSDRNKKRKLSEGETKATIEGSEKTKTTVDPTLLSPNLDQDLSRQDKPAIDSKEKKHSNKTSEVDDKRTTETVKLNIEEDLIRKYVVKHKTHEKKQKQKKPKEENADQKLRNTETLKLNTEQSLIEKYKDQDKSTIDTDKEKYSNKTYKTTETIKTTGNKKHNTEHQNVNKEPKQTIENDNKSTSDQESIEKITEEILLGWTTNVIHIEETETIVDSSNDDIFDILNDSSITLIDKESDGIGPTKETVVDAQEIVDEINNNNDVNSTFFALPETLPEDQLEVTTNLKTEVQNYQKATSKLILFEEHSQLNDFGNNKAQIVNPYIDLTSETRECDNFCNVLITNVRTDVSHFVKSEQSECSQMDVVCNQPQDEKKFELKDAAYSTLEDIEEEMYEMKNEDKTIPVFAKQTVVDNYLQTASSYSVTVLVSKQSNQAIHGTTRDDGNTKIDNQTAGLQKRPDQVQPESVRQAQIPSNITNSPKTFQTLSQANLLRLTDAFYYEVFEILKAYSFLKKQYESAFGSIQQTSQTSPNRYIQIETEKEFLANIIQSKRNTYSFYLLTLVNKLPEDMAYVIFRTYMMKIFQHKDDLNKIIALLFEFVENQCLPLSNIGNFPKFRTIVQVCQKEIWKRNTAQIMTEEQRLITKHQIEKYLELTRKNQATGRSCLISPTHQQLGGRNGTKKTSQSTSPQVTTLGSLQKTNIQQNSPSAAISPQAHARSHVQQGTSPLQPQRTHIAYQTMYVQRSTSGNSQPNVPTLVKTLVPTSIPNITPYGQRPPPPYQDKQLSNGQPLRNELFASPQNAAIRHVNNMNSNSIHTRAMGVNKSPCALCEAANVPIGHPEIYNLSKTVDRVIENCLIPKKNQPQVNITWLAQTQNTVRAQTTTQSFSQAPTMPDRNICVEPIEPSRPNISTKPTESVDIVARTETNSCPPKENTPVSKVPDPPSNVSTQEESQPSGVFSEPNKILRKLLFSVGDNVSIFQVTENPASSEVPTPEIPASPVNREPDTSTANVEPSASTISEEPTDDIVDLTSSDLVTNDVKDYKSIIFNVDTIDLTVPDLIIKDEEIDQSQNSDSDINQVTSTSNDESEAMKMSVCGNLEDDVKSQIIKYLDVKEEDKQQKPEDEVIDLTWLDDVPLKEELLENDDVMKTDEEEERASPTPSDSNEAENATIQSEYTSDRDILNNRQCFCGKTAEYLCYCATVMYCSKECQIYHWSQHQKTCSSTTYLQQ